MEDFCYHGVGESLIKFESVMKNGIVSQEMSKGIDGYTKQFDGYNGNDRISVVIPHEVDEYWKQYIVQADALGMFILKGGISFKIENCPYVLAQNTKSGSSLFDEGFVRGKIPKGNISGIIVTSKIRDKKISDLSFLGANFTEQAVQNVKMLMQLLTEQGISNEQFKGIEDLITKYEIAKKTYLESLDSNSIDFVEKRAEMDNITFEMDKIIATSFETLYKRKCGKSSITIMDVVEFYNDRGLPIYDENDVVQQCKGLEVPTPEKIIKEPNGQYMEGRIIPQEEQIENASANAIQKSIKEGTFMQKTFGLKRTIAMLRSRWNNRNKSKENIYNRGE